MVKNRLLILTHSKFLLSPKNRSSDRRGSEKGLLIKPTYKKTLPPKKIGGVFIVQQFLCPTI